jgi:hypothetical protein
MLTLLAVSALIFGLQADGAKASLPCPSCGDAAIGLMHRDGVALAMDGGDMRFEGGMGRGGMRGGMRAKAAG